MSVTLNRRICAALDALVAQNILSAGEAQRIAERYPTTPWDARSYWPAGSPFLGPSRQAPEP